MLNWNLAFVPCKRCLGSGAACAVKIERLSAAVEVLERCRACEGIGGTPVRLPKLVLARPQALCLVIGGAP
jgi:hypothetical protein